MKNFIINLQPYNLTLKTCANADKQRVCGGCNLLCFILQPKLQPTYNRKIPYFCKTAENIQYQHFAKIVRL